VMPAAIATPFFEHSANYTGRAVKPPRPIYDPEHVARSIVAAAYHPRREVFVGGAARAMNVLHALAPTLYEQTARALTDFDHFQDRAAAPTPGAVLNPVPAGTGVRGGWRAPRESRRHPTSAGSRIAVAWMGLTQKGSTTRTAMPDVASSACAASA